MAELGLLQFRNASELQAEEEAERQAREEERRRELIESSLASHIRKSWEDAKTAKRDIERRMIDCMRRRKGEYDPQKEQAIAQEGGSLIYMMITATKCRAASSWIRDVLMPTNERPWGLDPTPVAEIPPEYKTMLAQQVQAQAQQIAQQGQQVSPLQMQQMMEEAQEQLRHEAQMMARKASERHEERIEDQLAEGGWQEALEAFVDDFVTFPGAILKGPVMRRVPTLEWAEGWQPVKSEMVRPEFERVSPFDIYPSPDASNIDDGAYLIERIRYTRSTLHNLRGMPGYNDEALEEVLSEYGEGGLRDWLWTDSERASLEGRGHEWLTSSNLIDGLQYWGSAQGLTLLQWGVDPDQVDDPLADYEIEAVLIGRSVIRCVINRDPLGKRPYHKASYQPVPGSFWGQGIPELMADIQDTCNATARSLINNLAIASGPQVEVTDRLEPGEDATNVHPWKIWRTKASQTTSGDPAIRFYQPSSNAGELMGVYEKFELRADDATNIPRYAYGNERVGGAGQTASGLSMLMESANKGIKDAIRHIDRGVIRRVIEALWLHNMLYDPDQSIKGDCRAVPRGSSAMLQREQTQQLRNQFMQSTANPIDMGIIGVPGRARLLRSIAETLDMPDLIPNDREIDAQQAQQGQMQQAQAQLEQAIQQAEAQEKAANAQEAQADAQQAQVDAQHQQAMSPLEQRKLMAEILKLITEMRGGNGANGPAMGGAGQNPEIGGRQAFAGGASGVQGGSPRAAGSQQPGGYAPPSGPGGAM